MASDLLLVGRGFSSHRTKLRNNLGQVVHTRVPLSPIGITWYWLKDGDVLQLGRRPQGDDLKVTCMLTACTPGSALGPTLSNEYGDLYFFTLWHILYVVYVLDSLAQRNRRQVLRRKWLCSRRDPVHVRVLLSMPSALNPIEN